MPVEAGHVQIQEFNKEVIPSLNWMLEDVFCRYGVAMPYFMLDFAFPDYSQRPEWVTYTPPDWYLPEWKAYWPTFLNQWPNWMEGTGFNFNIDWGPWGYWLPWFNELLGLLFDEAELPRWQMPDFSPSSMAMLNERLTAIYGAVSQEFDATYGGSIRTRVTGSTQFGDTWASVWAEYLTATPVYLGAAAYDMDVRYFWDASNSAYDSWRMWTVRGYITFDTSSLAGKTLSSAVLKLYITNYESQDLDQVEGDNTIQIRETSFETPSASTWNTGDVVGSKDLDDCVSGAYNEITLDTSYINKTGNTQFEIGFKADFDDYAPDDPLVKYSVPEGEHIDVGTGHIYVASNESSNKPVLVIT